MSPRLNITVIRPPSQQAPAPLQLRRWDRIRLFGTAALLLGVVAVIFVVTLIVGSVIAPAILATLAFFAGVAILRVKFRRTGYSGPPKRC